MTDWMTPEQKKFQAEVHARHDAAKRMLGALFGFWRACGQKPCRRRHSCMGDPHACFRRCWPHVPQAVKAAFRAAVKTRSEEAA